MNNMEKRGGLLGVETRATDEKRTLTGYAAVFDSPTDIGGYWTETIAPGAFAKSISGDVRALVNHNMGRVIGRTKSGTLRLEEDEKGLRIEVDVPNTTDGNDLWELVTRGDISGMSFGFAVTKQEWDYNTEPAKRTIKEVELFEVSAVAFPAYDDTTIGKRSLDAAKAAAAAEAAQVEADTTTDNEDPASPPVNKVATIRSRQKMDLELKVRSSR